MSKLFGRDMLRERVRERDGHRCIICGTTGNGKRRLDVHHLDENLNGKTGNKYSNNPYHRMVTLCHKCHKEHHAGYPKQKYDPDPLALSKYLKLKLSWT